MVQQILFNWRFNWQLKLIDTGATDPKLVKNIIWSAALDFCLLRIHEFVSVFIIEPRIPM